MLEVSYLGTNRNLDGTAEKYMRHSKGHMQVVVGFALECRETTGKRATSIPPGDNNAAQGVIAYSSRLRRKVTIHVKICNRVF